MKFKKLKKIFKKLFRSVRLCVKPYVIKEDSVSLFRTGMRGTNLGNVLKKIYSEDGSYSKEYDYAADVFRYGNMLIEDKGAGYSEKVRRIAREVESKARRNRSFFE